MNQLEVIYLINICTHIQYKHQNSRQEEVFIIIMKLTFTNKKQNKNCHYFIKALNEIGKHNLKDNYRPVYMYASKEQLRLAPCLSDLHKERTENNCLITFKSDVYTIHFEDNIQFKLLCLHSAKLLKSFTKKNGNKITLIELSTTNKGITVEHESDGGQIVCIVNIEAEEVNHEWPQSPLSTREDFYNIIKVCKLSWTDIKNINMQNQQQIWLQFLQGGICLKASKSSIKIEDSVKLKEQSEYNYITIKSKLQNKQFVNLNGQFFFDHLRQCQKKKRTTSFHLKNIYDRYLENEIRSSYIIMQTKVEFGTIYKIIGCFIAAQMGLEGEELIRREIHQQRERQAPKESYLLKAEQNNSQRVRNVVLNRFNEVDGQAMIAEEIFKERRPLGKIEQGQETFTRKFYSKF